MADLPRSRCAPKARGCARGRLRHLSRLAVPALPAVPPGRRSARRRSRRLVEGVRDGLSFQTLLGVTGSGKTFTMANVIAQIGRPAIVFAPNKTLAAQLYSEFREFFPEERGRVLRQLLRLLPARGLRAAARPVHREGQRDQRAHRADAPVGDQERAGAARRDHRRLGRARSTASARPRTTPRCG